jgi:VanZ family protein
MKGTRSFLALALPGSLFVIWLIGLWVLSSLPGEEIELPPFPGADKLAHLLYFAVGGALLAFSIRAACSWKRWSVIWTVLLAMLVIGAVDEFHQLHTANRAGADPFDWLADCAGGFLGAIVIGWLYGRASDRSGSPAGRVAAEGD